MKGKLKAIWRILRSKSYFYTAHVADKFISDHEIGNQPKGGVPAYVRVDVMFAELNKLTAVVKDHVQRMSNRYHDPQFKDENNANK